MSKIYQPPESPFAPLYIDCLNNALMRQNLNFTTSSTSLVTVKDIPLIANLFDIDGKRLSAEVEGFLDSAGASDGLQFGVSFDSVAQFAVTITTVRDLGSYLAKLKAFRVGANLRILLYVESEPTQTTQNNAQLSGNYITITPNFAIAHTLTLTARVVTGTSVLTAQGCSVSVL